MFMPIIRYKNESNSQRIPLRSAVRLRCLCQSLDTRMKAIHNSLRGYLFGGLMFMPIIRYKNESNSQPLMRYLFYAARCLCQSLDTRMKAIHNLFSAIVVISLDVNTIFRDMFESN